MSFHARRLTLPFLLVTVGLVIALGLHPVSTNRILAAYVLALAALGLELMTRVLSSRSASGQPSEFEQALARKRHRPTRPTDLLRIERELSLGAASAGHLHTRLLPMLREAASARLGFDLHRSPERAHTALGDEAWELLRPDRPAPEDRHGTGAPLPKVEHCIETLERL
ncbi:MAG TPA: hypothetical protein VHQ89_06950 [Gaiellaceae bacterium]|jgi:hypothetical protein|nr:hypothetical protein [Gaiellaceae bacterium]